MSRKSKKSNLKNYGIIFVVGLFLGTLVVALFKDNWSEPVLVRQSIITIERAKYYIIKGDLEAAGFLLSDVDTYMWYLRNSKNIFFYERVYYDKDYWICDFNLIHNYSFSPEACTVSSLTELQQALCPKSDIPCEELFMRYGFNCEYSVACTPGGCGDVESVCEWINIYAHNGD